MQPHRRPPCPTPRSTGPPGTAFIPPTLHESPYMHSPALQYHVCRPKATRIDTAYSLMHRPCAAGFPENDQLPLPLHHGALGFRVLICLLLSSEVLCRGGCRVGRAGVLLGCAVHLAQECLPRLGRSLCLRGRQPCESNLCGIVLVGGGHGTCAALMFVSYECGSRGGRLAVCRSSPKSGWCTPWWGALDAAGQMGGCGVPGPGLLGVRPCRQRGASVQAGQPRVRHLRWFRKGLCWKRAVICGAGRPTAFLCLASI
jgi:hypothetical protein